MSKWAYENGVILYRGPSLLDGKPIICIATGLKHKSRNLKTGAMVQTYILRDDLSPMAAIDRGADASICGDCPARGGDTWARFCYVDVGKSVQGVWRARDGYRAEWSEETFRGRKVRLGAYGDPAAVPYWVWQRVLRYAAGHTGYTHQWRAFPEMAQFVMASCDSETDRVHARMLGFRTFRTRLDTEPKLEREVICPASEEAGHKTTCFALRCLRRLTGSGTRRYRHRCAWRGAQGQRLCRVQTNPLGAILSPRRCVLSVRECAPAPRPIAARDENLPRVNANLQAQQQLR